MKYFLKFIWKKVEKPSYDRQFVSYVIENLYLIEHDKLSLHEVEFLNHIEIDMCPHCKKNKIIKYGRYKNGVQRYQCKKCHRIFSPLTNTIFDSKKKSLVKWVHYLLYLFSSCSLDSDLRNCLTTISTEKYWLTKIFKTLKRCQKNILLDGIVCFEISPFLEIEKSRNTKKNDEKKNKIGVILALDNHQHFFFKVVRLKSSVDHIWRAIKDHIQPFSKLICSEERYCKTLISQLHLNFKVYKKENFKGKVDPLDRVLCLKSLLEKFLKEHQGKYKIDNLQDWLNLFWFIISDSNDMTNKITKFINLSLNDHKKMRYREIMRKSLF